MTVLAVLDGHRVARLLAAQNCLCLGRCKKYLRHVTNARLCSARVRDEQLARRCTIDGEPQ
eukprot:1879623-Prymnesium_polylepis.2